MGNVESRGQARTTKTCRGFLRNQVSSNVKTTILLERDKSLVPVTVYVGRGDAPEPGIVRVILELHLVRVSKGATAGRSPARVGLG